MTTKLLRYLFSPACIGCSMIGILFLPYSISNGCCLLKSDSTNLGGFP